MELFLSLFGFSMVIMAYKLIAELIRARFSKEKWVKIGP